MTALGAHDFASPSSVLPLSAVLESIPNFPRPVIERLVARLIEHLDKDDGDPELEDAEGQLSCIDARGHWLRDASWLATEDDEEDDPSGGSVDDDGEPSCSSLVLRYATDQRIMLADNGLQRWRDE